MIHEKLMWFIKVCLVALSFLLFFALIRLIYPDEIVFYQGNRVIFFNSIIWVLIFYVVGGCSLVAIFKSIDILFAAGVLCFAILSTFPVILDRSITLHMLYKLNMEKAVSVEDLQEDFVVNFVYKSRAIEKRIAEQIEIGNVTYSNNIVEITKKGERYQASFDFLNKFFNIKPTYFKDEK